MEVCARLELITIENATALGNDLLEIGEDREDLPPRSTVHGWFVRWHCDGVLDRLHFALYQQVRELEGRHASPTAAIVDSQSVKSAEKGGGTSTQSATTRPRRSRARSATSSSTRWACTAPGL